MRPRREGVPSDLPKTPMRPRVTSVGLLMPPPPTLSSIDEPLRIDRASLDGLPSKPGVYLFLDADGMPLYIGKSVNIRSRVLAHLRTPEEAAMLRESRRVDHIRTAGEIGALLLESQLIKQRWPVYNILLKESAHAYALRLAAGDTRPQVAVSSDPEAFEPEYEPDALHGLFASRSAADEGLRRLARRHGLCPALLGLETTTHGRACFSHQLGQCRGACVGSESADAHLERLRLALAQMQAQVWPYDGPLGILERDQGWRQVHVIDRWRYLGSLSGRQKKLRIPAGRGTDMDTYKILCQPLATDALTIVGCETRDGFVYCRD
jgi:excinuclease Cho